MSAADELGLLESGAGGGASPASPPARASAARRWAFRALLFVVGVPYAAIWFAFLAGQAQQAFAARNISGLSPDAAAAVTLASTDRILSLLEVTLGVIALLLPLALGVMIYIYQQNSRTQRALAQRATDAMNAAMQSEALARDSRNQIADSKDKIAASGQQISRLDIRVQQALASIEKEEQTLLEMKLKLGEALERDEKMDRQVSDALVTIETLRSRLQTQMTEAKAHVSELDRRVKEAVTQAEQYQQEVEQLRQALKELQRMQPELVQFTTLSEIQSKSVLMFSSDSFKARSAVLSLLEYTRDPSFVVRREAVRAFTRVPDASAAFPLPVAAIVRRLQEISAGDSEPGVQLEARRILDKFANGGGAPAA